jgi:hypothetical protein
VFKELSNGIALNLAIKEVQNHSILNFVTENEGETTKNFAENKFLFPMLTQLIVVVSLFFFIYLFNNLFVM